MSSLATVNKMPPTVSVEWLGQNLNTVKILDASWFMPNENRNPRAEFLAERIEGSQFFDIDEVCDKETNLPHMLPSESKFSEAVSSLSIANNDKIVVYDKKGIFSSARVWWMFRVFGHENVYVLDGGFPAYKEQNLPISLGSPEAKTPIVAKESSPFVAKFQPSLIWGITDVFSNLESKSFQVVDARSNGRFLGVDPEPRAGVRGGHIPNSFSVPFTQVLKDGYLKPDEGLRGIFENSGIDLTRPVVTSCGTGVTACVLSLALYQLGLSVPVYDGSWMEWERGTTPQLTSNEISLRFRA